MKLIIAEKPSVGASIANVIGAKERKDGYIEGNGYIVSWCIGHLVSFSNPDKYDEKYEKWNIEDLPIIPSDWKFETSSKTKKQYNILKNLVKDKRVTSLICATDAGREGELIFRLVINHIGINKPIERLWISSMEDIAIQKGMNELKSGDDYLNLYESALARAKADWLVGMNYSRLYSTSYYQNYPVGRVQTPTLAIIVKRDRKIENFEKEKYYTIEVVAKKGNKEIKFISEKLEDINSYKNILYNSPEKLKVETIEKEEKVVRSPRLHNLTTLQREANKVFGYTAQQTLDYAQSLYEKKLVTYPRTDSNYLSEDMADTIKELINFANVNLEKSDKNFNSIFNNSKVSDHHALIPTVHSYKEKFEVPSFEQNIYNLINFRLLESISEDYTYLTTTITSSIEELKLIAKGKININKGFKLIEEKYKTTQDTEVDLPELRIDELLNIASMVEKENYTKPPKRFTEDSLLSAMENAGVEELDKDLETEKRGLGTSATRSSIIERLIKTEYISRDKKNLISTEKGRNLIQIVDEKLKSPKTTAFWENKLTEISTGEYSSKEFLENITKDINLTLNGFQTNIEPVNQNLKKEILGICPLCSGEVIEGKQVYFCKNEKCSFRIYKTISTKHITKAIANELLKNKKTNEYHKFKSKSEKDFEAKLILDKTGKTIFEFRN